MKSFGNVILRNKGEFTGVTSYWSWTFKGVSSLCSTLSLSPGAAGWHTTKRHKHMRVWWNVCPAPHKELPVNTLVIIHISSYPSLSLLSPPPACLVLVTGEGGRFLEVCRGGQAIIPTTAPKRQERTRKRVSGTGRRYCVVSPRPQLADKAMQACKTLRSLLLAQC